MTQVVAMFIVLGGLCVLLYGLEALFPSVRGQPLWRCDSKTDVVYLLFTPLVTRWIAKAVALVGVVLALRAMGHTDVQRAADGFGPLAHQPGWLIAAEMFLLGDLLGYWIHRGFHSRALWKFHAVHHSSTQLD